MTNMFEQPLYEFKPADAQPPEQDLFKDYEIKSWVLTPRIYKILGLSLLLNILAIVIVAQTSLLTRKGCDSPFVGSICQALDTVYVGSLLFGTEREYVDAAYDKTDLEDADITFVDMSHVSPKLYYPADYAKYANSPEEIAAVEQTFDNNGFGGFTNDIPGIPNGLPMAQPNGDTLFNTQPNIPKANPNPIEGELPKAGNSYGGGYNAPMYHTTKPKNTFGRRPYVQTNPDGSPVETPNSNLTADAKTPAPTAAPTVAPTPAPTPSDVKQDKFGVFINVRPLKDGAKETLEKLDANQIKLDPTFKTGVVGTLGLAKDGNTVVLKNPKALPPDKNVHNDPLMEKFVQEWILRVGDSGWLGYIERLDELKKKKDKRVQILVEQNDTELVATVTAEQQDENTASALASGLNVILSTAASNTDGDEQLFLKGATSTTVGKSLVLNIHLPKPMVQDMIKRKLTEYKAQLKQSNGSEIKPLDNTAKK